MKGKVYILNINAFLKNIDIIQVGIFFTQRKAKHFAMAFLVFNF
jgi:hypothetical protein